MHKKGFTIVETIIAFTIISLVALAATSIITISKSSNERSNSEFLAENFCSNSFELLRAVDKRNSFDDFYGEYFVALKTIDIDIPSLPCNQFDIYVDSSFNQANVNNYSNKCEYCFTRSGNVLTLSITITDDSDKTVCSYSYSIILKEGV